jgi:hypothetical protein
MTHFAGMTSPLMWTTLGSCWRAVLGSAIDPADQVYYAYGSYAGSWYAFDLDQTWVFRLSLFSVNDGMALLVRVASVASTLCKAVRHRIGPIRAAPTPGCAWLSETHHWHCPADSAQSIDVTFDAVYPK